MKNFAFLALLLSAALLFGCLGGGGTPTATPVATATPQVSIAPTVSVTASPTPKPTSTPTPEPTKATKEIRIKDYKFVPDRITVKKGEKVVWVNEDLAKHTVTRDAGFSSGPESKLLAQGEKYEYTFDAVGITAYHCDPHPYMKATVEVVG